MSQATAGPLTAVEASPKSHLEKFVYDDAISRKFLLAMYVWAVVAFLVGLYVAMQLPFPGLTFGVEYLTFGRLRPLHTNAAIFA